MFEGEEFSKAWDVEGLDIDGWEDLYLAEAYLAYKDTIENREYEYLSEGS